MEETFRIVRMGYRHVDAVAQLEELCFSEPWSRQAVCQELENPQAVLFAAEWGGALAGYAGLRYVMDEAYLSNLAVFPRFRHRGVGRALLQAQKRFCQGRGFAMLTLEVRASNATAIGLYRSEGFQTVGRRKNFYRIPTEDAVLMTVFFDKTGGDGENAPQQGGTRG